MSHFTVLVVGKDHEKALAPFHEFECTGEDDEFVQDIDETEEDRQEYESHTHTKNRNIATRELADTYSDQFYRDPTVEEQARIEKRDTKDLFTSSKDWGEGRGYRARVRFVPEGWETVEIPSKELMTFADFIKYWHGRNAVIFGSKPELSGDHKYGYVLLNADGSVQKSIKRTNPNDKWDWYSVGGRWAGFFKLKPGVIVAERGEQSWMQKMSGEAYPEGHADRAYKGDIDWAGMKASRIVEAEKAWADYDAQKDKHDAKDPYWHFGIQKGESREAFIKRKGSISTFAVIKDGKWYERGSMGWWAVISDEKDQDAWDREFMKLFESLPEDTLLTLVDCHI